MTRNPGRIAGFLTIAIALPMGLVATLASSRQTHPATTGTAPCPTSGYHPSPSSGGVDRPGEAVPGFPSGHQAATIPVGPETPRSGEANEMHHLLPSSRDAATDGFHELSEDDQFSSVARLESGGQLSERQMSTFEAKLSDASISPVVRNEISNLLLWQDQVPDLTPRFIHAIDDEKENPNWQDFAVQQLAVDAERMGDPSIAVPTLTRISQSHRPVLSGTALIQLDRIFGNGTEGYPDGFFESVRRTLGDPRTDPATRITALSILAKHRDKAALPDIRALAHAQESPLKRVAIAALGEYGDASDLSVVDEAARSSDPLLASAAQAAAHKIRLTWMDPQAANDTHAF